MKTVFTFLTISILFIPQLVANNNIEDITIENVEFPQSVSIGDIATFKCDIVNTSAAPITLDFDLNFNITTTNDDFSEVDETEPFENETFAPGERKSVERPIYINNARAASNTNNLIAAWPAARGATDQRGTASETDFYVEAEEELERGQEVIYNECDIEIMDEDSEVTINGLTSEFEISIIDQEGVVNYMCNGNCPNDQVIVDLPDFGFFFVQVKSLLDQQCISFSSIIVGDWDSNELDEDLNDIFYIPYGAYYDFESAIEQQIDSIQQEIDSIQFQIDSIQFQTDNLQPLDCEYDELFFLPRVNNILETSAFVSLAGFYNNVNCEIKESGLNVWTPITLENDFALLNQLKSCTTYDIRNTYVCSLGKIVSDVVTFETEGCENTCEGNDIKLYQLASYSNGVVLNWDFLPGKSYLLKYKTTDQIEWNVYNTISSIALLFGLEPCSTYEFKVSTECENDLLNIESNVIILETGNCKLGSNLLIDEGLAVYPTIATNYIDIVLNDTEDIEQLSIYDLAGNLVKPINPKVNTASVSDLPSGTYLITGITKNSILSTKFIKQ